MLIYEIVPPHASSKVEREAATMETVEWIVLLRGCQAKSKRMNFVA
jgi:hypothetical protein